MLKKSYVISILLIFSTGFSAWGLDFKPGKYEITIQMEMPGLPSMPPQTITQCLNEENPVPASSADSKSCKILEKRTKGNTLFYTTECVQDGTKVKITGETTYRSDSFEGTTQTKLGPGAGDMIIKTNIKGKRIGKCD